MKLQSLLLSPFSHPKPPRVQCLHTSQETSVFNEVLAAITTNNPMEPVLERMVPFLSPEIVTSIIQNPPNPQLGFRFFIWASHFKRLCSPKSRELITDRLIVKDGLELYCQTLEELKTCGIKVPTDAFNVVIQFYIKMGLDEKAVESFDLMRDFGCGPDVLTYNMILNVLIKKNVLLLALALYTRMIKVNCLPNVVTFGILIDGMCKHRNIKDALRLFDEMAERGILPDEIIYTSVISGLCKAKRVDDAYRLLDKMKDNGIRPGLFTYSCLLDGLCKLGRFDDAFELLRLFENDGYVPDVYVYSCLIDGLFRAKRCEDVELWYRKMIANNIKPDVTFYTIMMKGLAEAGKVSDAVKLLNEMTESGMVPDTVCSNALIKGFCDMGFLNEARSLMHELSKHGDPNTQTYSILIHALCRKHLVRHAQKIFSEMEKHGCHPSVVTFNSLIHGLCKTRQLDKARLLFHKMEGGRNPSLLLRLSQGPNRTLDSASLRTMVEQLCDSGLIHKAYNILTQLANIGAAPDICTYNILVNGFSKAGNFNGAYKLLTVMQFKGISPNSVTYGILINGLLKFKREKDAFKVFDQMEKNGCIPGVSVYMAMMTWMCRRRKLTVAFSLWLKHLKNIRREEDEAIKAIERYFDEGEVEKAVRGLVEMDFKLKDFDLNPYTVWLIGLCVSGRVEEALKIFSVLDEHKITVTPPSCVMLIYHLCKIGNLNCASDVFLYSIEKGYTLGRWVSNYLLKKLLHSKSAGEKNHAFYLLRRMKSLGYDHVDARVCRLVKCLLHGFQNMQKLENMSPG